MIHYHGTPITPRSVLATLRGRNFCVSYAAPGDVAFCHEIGQSVMLDNGAFSFWKKGKQTNWSAYYSWCAQWLEYWTTWAVIPDVIDGEIEENDALIAAWPFKQHGAPVWHLHEPITRLAALAEDWQRVCFGSSGQYATVGSEMWHQRISEAFEAICENGVPKCQVHMLRGMSMSGGPYPFASVDSTDIARNHHVDGNDARKMAERWDGMQTPARFSGKVRRSLFS